MNESCDKPCYPHDYIICAKQIPGWGSPHGRWEVELARAEWSCLTSAILQSSQPQWKRKSVMASGSTHCSLIPSYLAARQLTFSKAAHILLAEMRHSQGMTLVCRGFQTGPRRNCGFNLNVLAACQMTRPRRNEVRAAVAELCHDFAMSPSWLIRNHESSQTFSISFSEARLHFALQSEPNDQWAPAGDVFTGSRSKGISRQKHKSSPQLCCWT